LNYLNALVQGVMLGGLYALFATGLALIFGVMRLVNIAHGDLIVLAAYLGLSVVQFLGLHPLATLLIVAPAMCGLGYLLQRGIFNRTLGGDLLPPLLVSFGLSVIVQNGLQQVFTADSRRLQAGALEVASLELPGHIAVGILPLMTFLAAIAIMGALQFLFYRTPLGRALRATSDDQSAAKLMGIDNRHIYGIAMALAFAVIAIAGIFLGMGTNFDPASGPARLLFAFEAVIIGGLGNMWGALLGGIIIGVAQTIGAEINPANQVLAGHLVFLAILLFRPEGLLPKVS
jgi:branched-chain amino acid transport system permease protein